MPADLSSVHVNRSLADLSIQFMNEAGSYLLPQICARRPVTNLSDSYFTYGREGYKPSQAGSNAKYRASVTVPGAPATEAEYTVTSSTYQCHRYSKRCFVSDAEILLADSPLQPLQDAARQMMQRIMQDAELVLAMQIADAGNYPAGGQVVLTTGANGTSWHKNSMAGTGSDPLTNLRDARVYVEKSIGREANVLAISAEALYHLADHTDLSGLMQYTDSMYLQRGNGLPPVLRGLQIARASAIVDTAAEGAAFAADYLFNDWTDLNYECAIVCYIPPGKVIGPRGFASFIWFDGEDETTHQRGVSSRAYRDEGKRGYWVEAAQTFDVQAGIIDSASKITGAYFIGRAIIP